MKKNDEMIFFINKIDGFLKRLKKNYKYFYDDSITDNYNYFDTLDKMWFYYDNKEFLICFDLNYTEYYITIKNNIYEQMTRKEFFQYIKKYDDKIKYKTELNNLLTAKTIKTRKGCKI
jgi:hypothetical protein